MVVVLTLALGVVQLLSDSGFSSGLTKTSLHTHERSEFFAVSEHAQVANQKDIQLFKEFVGGWTALLVRFLT